MALGDYILCCKCEVKLIYDGDRRAREWWEERFDKPPEIECPDCKTPPRQPLTDEEIEKIWGIHRDDDEHFDITYERDITRAIEAELRGKNNE